MILQGQQRVYEVTGSKFGLLTTTRPHCGYTSHMGLRPCFFSSWHLAAIIYDWGSDSVTCRSHQTDGNFHYLQTYIFYLAYTDVFFILKMWTLNWGCHSVGEHTPSRHDVVSLIVSTTEAWVWWWVSVRLALGGRHRRIRTQGHPQQLSMVNASLDHMRLITDRCSGCWWPTFVAPNTKLEPRFSRMACLEALPLAGQRRICFAFTLCALSFSTHRHKHILRQTLEGQTDCSFHWQITEVMLTTLKEQVCTSPWNSGQLRALVLPFHRRPITQNAAARKAVTWWLWKNI